MQRARRTPHFTDTRGSSQKRKNTSTSPLLSLIRTRFQAIRVTRCSARLSAGKKQLRLTSLQRDTPPSLPNSSKCPSPAHIVLPAHETNDANAKERVRLLHCPHPCTLLCGSPSPPKYHTAANDALIFFFSFLQASPDPSARSPTLPGLQFVFSRWHLAKTQLPSGRAPIHIRVLHGDRSPPQSTLSPSAVTLGEAQKHPLYPHCRRGGGEICFCFS